MHGSDHLLPEDQLKERMDYFAGQNNDFTVKTGRLDHYVAEAKKYFLQEYNCEALPKFWRGMVAGMLGNMSDMVNEKISYWYYH